MSFPGLCFNFFKENSKIKNKEKCGSLFFQKFLKIPNKDFNYKQAISNSDLQKLRNMFKLSPSGIRVIALLAIVMVLNAQTITYPIHTGLYTKTVTTQRTVQNNDHEHNHSQVVFDGPDEEVVLKLNFQFDKSLKHFRVTQLNYANEDPVQEEIIEKTTEVKKWNQKINQINQLVINKQIENESVEAHSSDNSVGKDVTLQVNVNNHKDNKEHVTSDNSKNIYVSKENIQKLKIAPKKKLNKKLLTHEQEEESISSTQATTTPKQEATPITPPAETPTSEAPSSEVPASETPVVAPTPAENPSTEESAPVIPLPAETPSSEEALPAAPTPAENPSTEESAPVIPLPAEIPAETPTYNEGEAPVASPLPENTANPISEGSVSGDWSLFG